ncbi:hypothetical protein RN001_009154 [Aquatica leii]|uniref:15-hydroxyprostaglandin dehydrogenase [NAD(+)]-like n=1 Tax=Aquatica leii TaxID=1421715 RepID=A0AAN7QFV1_9COLE|nr:hypothetical protein RN001_009154 [Aquatica leii]
MFGIFGKVALVSGGASGIGLATVEGLLQDGLKGVTIVDLNETNGNQVVEDLNQKYGDNKALFCKANVSQRNEFEDAFKLTISAFQNLDIVINCAGIIKDRNWEEEIAVNLTGTVTGSILAIENYLPSFKTGSEAVILNVSSLSGVYVYSGFPIYGTSKSGGLRLTQNLGTKLQYERSKVRVMALCPGLTDTPLIQLGATSFLHDDYKKILAHEIGDYSMQTVSFVSKATVQIIKEAENGSVWIIKDNKTPFEVEITHRQLL